MKLTKELEEWMNDHEDEVVKAFSDIVGEIHGYLVADQMGELSIKEESI